MTVAGPQDPFFDEPGAEDDYADWTFRGVACSLLLVVAFVLVFCVGCAERPTGLVVRRTDGRVVAIMNGETVAEAPRHALECAHARAIEHSGTRECPDCWWRVHK